MELYRICQENFAEDLSGKGSRLFGGRWNSEGNYALYTSSHRSLALLETLVHTPVKILQQKNYMLISISVSDDISVQTIDIKKFPEHWDETNIHFFTQKKGDEFLAAKKKLLLRVPSVLVKEEFNYIINPLHPDMKQVKIIQQRKLNFNDRLLRAF
ncbi:MAG: RES family NAD+ phosphorylase [Sphingobacteriales bacterium]|nr:RES family NAD+ phosphorylase [Sphingobacteriales bacterium]MBI3720034.1 RES family NAD+ phosphorylase [Sphingobacteriales bacterium]